MQDFQHASFVPFDHYVQKAKRREGRVFNTQARRAADFIDAVIVSEVAIESVPEFADVAKTIYPAVDVSISDENIALDNLLQAKLHRARNAVAAHAFAECLHAGFFPPSCQSCLR